MHCTIKHRLKARFLHASEIDPHPGYFRSTSALWAAPLALLSEVTSLPLVQSDVIVQRSGALCLEKITVNIESDMIYPCFGDHMMTATLPIITTVPVLVTFVLIANYFQIANCFSFRAIVLAVHPF